MSENYNHLQGRVKDLSRAHKRVAHIAEEIRSRQAAVSEAQTEYEEALSEARRLEAELIALLADASEPEVQEPKTLASLVNAANGWYYFSTVGDTPRIVQIIDNLAIEHRVASYGEGLWEPFAVSPKRVYVEAVAPGGYVTNERPRSTSDEPEVAEVVEDAETEGFYAFLGFAPVGWYAYRSKARPELVIEIRRGGNATEWVKRTSQGETFWDVLKEGPATEWTSALSLGEGYRALRSRPKGTFQ